MGDGVIIILATSRKEQNKTIAGTVVYTKGDVWDLGVYVEDWIEEEFVDYDGEVSIKNKSSWTIKPSF